MAVLHEKNFLVLSHVTFCFLKNIQFLRKTFSFLLFSFLRSAIFSRFPAIVEILRLRADACKLSHFSGNGRLWSPPRFMLCILFRQTQRVSLGKYTHTVIEFIRVSGAREANVVSKSAGHRAGCWLVRFHTFCPTDLYTTSLFPSVSWTNFFPLLPCAPLRSRRHNARSVCYDPRYEREKWRVCLSFSFFLMFI